MRLPGEFRPCEGCRNFAALVDGNVLVCRRLGRLFMVAVCRLREREEDDGLSGDVRGRVHPGPAADRLEGRE